MSARCPACGGVLAAWTRENIIAAAQRWASEHGEPPRTREWFTASPDWPGHSTALRVFGTWNAMLTAAGLPTRRSGGQQRWTRVLVEDAFLRWNFLRGELPTFAEWVSPPEGFPVASVVAKLYGSWNAGVVAAGYQPRLAHRTEEGYARQSGAASRVRGTDGTFAGATA